MTIPLSKLRRSPDNIRKTNAIGGLDELAASIAALGVLQNLTVRATASTGKKAPTYEVVAGGRRLAALKLLAKKKRIAAGYPVPCRILADDDATEVSLAENVVRAPLHPADQFEAFSKLQAEGHGTEEIAARFGIPPKTVQQRLKLAAVSPRLMDVYRAGDMTLDQLVAFTITDDHEAQERVWFESPSFDRQPASLRRMLTRSLVDGSDRRARYIGAAAFEAAGGTVVRDLFRPDDDGYFSDSQLLDRLVSERLNDEAETIRAEGWSWVETVPELDYAYLSSFRRIPPTEVDLSAEEEARLETLAGRHDELIAELDDDPPAGVVEEIDRISAELDALSRKREEWSDEDKARAGAVVSLDYHGTVCVTRGLSKEKAKARVPVRDAEESGSGAEDNAPQRTRTLSDSLIEDLSAHRTAALREVVAGSPQVALTALLYTLVLRVCFRSADDACADIRPTLVDLRPSADGIGESMAVAAMTARHHAWSERLPDVEDLWSWLAAQSDETRLELLAHCTAASINAVRRRYDGPASSRFAQADRLAVAAGLDMADWWEPTKDRYLGRVSKTFITAAVAEAVSPQAAENIEGMKKDAMALRAEELLTGSRWLPEVLRAPVSPADGEA
jgi:ParB family chromosome partitioning protein